MPGKHEKSWSLQKQAVLATCGREHSTPVAGELARPEPEFSPSWRMVGEYANGRHGWVLSLMFAAWGVSSLALAFAIRSQMKTRSGKIGLALLTVAGIGEAMAVVFDINHDLLHSLAGALGMMGLPIAAMLISIRLSRTQPWSVARKPLLWTANLTWVSLVLLAATLAADGHRIG
jgi:hypothetical membrane protein